MTNNPTVCQECESHETKCVSVDLWGSAITRQMVCTECPTEWTLEYQDPLVKDVRVYDA